MTEQEIKSAEPAVQNLEEEGEIAADYIEELLDIYDLDGDIDIDVRQGRAYLEVSSDGEDDLRLLSNPETVEALQELSRLAVQAKTGNFSRLILDIGGSRNAKAASLAKIVDKAIAKAQETGADVPLKPMSSYERKLAHDIIAAAGLTSESEGEGKDRHIVIKHA
ncbi:MAG: protein jag [Micrococcales bacterium]